MRERLATNQVKIIVAEQTTSILLEELNCITSPNEPLDKLVEDVRLFKATALRLGLMPYAIQSILKDLVATATDRTALPNLDRFLIQARGKIPT